LSTLPKRIREIRKLLTNKGIGFLTIEQKKSSSHITVVLHNGRRVHTGGTPGKSYTADRNFLQDVRRELRHGE